MPVVAFTPEQTDSLLPLHPRQRLMKSSGKHGHQSRYPGCKELRQHEGRAQWRDISINDGEFACWSVRPLRQINAAAHGRRAGGDLRGTVAIGERAVNELPPVSAMAMVFQSYALYPHMTVTTWVSPMLAKRPSG